MAEWNENVKASKIWVLLGLIGIGQLVALIYSLVKKKDHDRILGVLFILGWLGDIIIYFIQKDKDKYLSSMALYLLIGNILMAIGVIIVIFAVVPAVLYSTGVFSPSSTIGTTATGFSPFLVLRQTCGASGLKILFGNNAGTPVTLTGASISTQTGITGTGLAASGTVAIGGSFFINGSGSTAHCATVGAHYSASITIDYIETNSPSPKSLTTTGTVTGSASAISP